MIMHAKCRVRMGILAGLLWSGAPLICVAVCPTERSYPNGLRLSGIDDCAFSGGVLEVSNGIELSGRAKLTLINVTATLRNSQGQPNIRMSGQTELTLRGVAGSTTAIHLQETDGVLIQAQELEASAGPLLRIDGAFDH